MGQESRGGGSEKLLGSAFILKIQSVGSADHLNLGWKAGSGGFGLTDWKDRDAIYRNEQGFIGASSVEDQELSFGNIRFEVLKKHTYICRDRR